MFPHWIKSGMGEHKKTKNMFPTYTNRNIFEQLDRLYTASVRQHVLKKRPSRSPSFLLVNNQVFSYIFTLYKFVYAFSKIAAIGIIMNASHDI